MSVFNQAFDFIFRRFDLGSMTYAVLQGFICKSFDHYSPYNMQPNSNNYAQVKIWYKREHFSIYDISQLLGFWESSQIQKVEATYHN